MLLRMLVLVALLSALVGCATSEKVGDWLKPTQQGGGGGGEAVGSFLPEPWRTPAVAGLGLLGTLLSGEKWRRERKKARVIAKGVAKAGTHEVRKAIQKEARDAGVAGAVEDLAAEVRKEIKPPTLEQLAKDSPVP